MLPLWGTLDLAIPLCGDVILSASRGDLRGATSRTTPIDRAAAPSFAT
jgi:hypothetical protein